jgi:hypothetical protein
LRKWLICNVFIRYQKEDAIFATATLTAHRGATLVNRAELASYAPPEAEGRWKPVKHSLIVDLMHEELARREIQITNEEYAIQREGKYLFAALSLNWLETEKFAAALAFRHSNDKSKAMQMYAGVHVDAKDFGAVVKAHIAQLQTTYGTTYLVADRALYSADNLQKLAETRMK